MANVQGKPAFHFYSCFIYLWNIYVYFVRLFFFVEQIKFGKVYDGREDRFRRNIYNAMKLQIAKHQVYSEYGVQIQRLQLKPEDLLDTSYDERYINSKMAQNDWENYKV